MNLTGLMLINTFSYNSFRKNPGLRAAIFFSAIILINGCAEESPVENTIATSKIAGRIVSSNNQGSINKDYVSIAGASVSLLKLNSSGTLELISTSNITSDDEGKFILETSYTGSADLIISAEKEGKTWKAVLTSELKSGIMIYSQPLTEESTIEAEIYIEAKKSLYQNIQYANISVLITPEIAGLLVNDNNSRDLLLQAFEQAAYVEDLVIIKSELGGDVNKWKAAISFFTDGQETLERDLYFSDSNSESETAIKKYINSRILACEKAGLDAGFYYNAINITQKVFLNVSGLLGSELRFPVNKRIAFIKTILLKNAVEEEFAELGLSRKAILAGDILLNKITAAASEEEINKSFDEYYFSIINQLKTVSGLNTALITNSVTAITEISNNFWLTIKPDILPDEIAKAYIKYFEQANSVLEKIILLTGESKRQRILSLLFITGSNYKF